MFPSTETQTPPVYLYTRWLLKLIVQETFAYIYTMQGPLSSPKRTSEPSGWFLDGWIQPQRSQKSQTHEPHENQQPAATRGPCSAPSPQPQLATEQSAPSSTPRGNWPPQTRCSGNELPVPITSSDSFKWGQGPPRQLSADGLWAMGPQTQTGWEELGSTNASVPNSWRHKGIGGIAQGHMGQQERSQASQGINHHTASAKMVKSVSLKLAPRC